VPMRVAALLKMLFVEGRAGDVPPSVETQPPTARRCRPKQTGRCAEPLRRQGTGEKGGRRGAGSDPRRVLHPSEPESRFCHRLHNPSDKAPWQRMAIRRLRPATRLADFPPKCWEKRKCLLCAFLRPAPRKTGVPGKIHSGN